MTRGALAERRSNTKGSSTPRFPRWLRWPADRNIGGERYRVQIICVDDKLDPRLAAEGARRLTEKEGVRYIIGPNVEQTFTAAMPTVEKNRAMLFPYSFARGLYRPPSENSVLCQIAGYQAVPFIYRHLIEREGVETISIVAPGAPEGLRQRQDISKIASSPGLRVLSESSTYRSGSEQLEMAIPPALARNPDVPALPNVAPADAPRLINRARELGFRSYITTESAQDVEGLIRTMGPAADGLIMVGGASPPATRSARMNEFIRRFTRVTGSWNDEAGTKAYALEFVLATLQAAGKSAVDDIERFKSAIPHFSIDDPLVKGRSPLSYYGAKEFRQKRQIGIPLVVNTIQRGELRNLFVQRPEELLVWRQPSGRGNWTGDPPISLSIEFGGVARLKRGNGSLARLASFSTGSNKPRGRIERPVAAMRRRGFARRIWAPQTGLRMRPIGTDSRVRQSEISRESLGVAWFYGPSNRSIAIPRIWNVVGGGRSPREPVCIPVDPC